VAWVIPVAALAVAAVAAAGGFNRLVALRSAVRASWANVDTELCRRHDLITNLVAVVGAAATHERTVLKAVTAARRASDVPRRVEQEQVLIGQARQLLALAEAHPELRALDSFASLQRQLVITEDRIAAARRLHNNNVMSLNKRVETVPLTVIARVARIAREPYLELGWAIDQVPSVAIGGT
jgi:LemA protein